MLCLTFKYSTMELFNKNADGSWDNSPIIQRVEALAENANISVPALLDSADVSRVTFWRWKSGGNVSLTLLRNIHETAKRLSKKTACEAAMAFEGVKPVKGVTLEMLEDMGEEAPKGVYLIHYRKPCMSNEAEGIEDAFTSYTEEIIWPDAEILPEWAEKAQPSEVLCYYLG